MPSGLDGGVAADVGAVGEEESPPPHPGRALASSTATTPTTHLRRVSMSRDYQRAGEIRGRVRVLLWLSRLTV
jgi:hypothetical protein